MLQRPHVDNYKCLVNFDLEFRDSFLQENCKQLIE